MIQHVWTVACSHAVIDQESHLVSLLDVIEQINIPENPAPGKVVGIPVDVTSLWIREDPAQPEKGQARISFVSPTGVDLKSLVVPLDLSENERLRTRGRFIGIPAPEDGRYIFRVEIASENSEEWHEVAVIPLIISFNVNVPAEESPQPAEQPQSES